MFLGVNSDFRRSVRQLIERSGWKERRVATLHEIRDMIDRYLDRIGVFFGSGANHQIKFTDGVELDMERRRYCQNRAFRP